MAKFKVGDKVTDGSAQYQITGIKDGAYEWKVIKGASSTSKGGMVNWADNKMTLVNAKFKVGDMVNLKKNRNAAVRIVKVEKDGPDTVYKCGHYLKGGYGTDFMREEELGEVVIPSKNSCSVSKVVANAKSWCGNGVVAKNRGKCEVYQYPIGQWWYSFAEGGKSGKEGPFKTEQQARVAAKMDGYKVVNAADVTKNATPDRTLAASSWGQGIGTYTKMKEQAKNLISSIEQVVVTAQDAASLFKTVSENGKPFDEMKTQVETAKKNEAQCSKAALSLISMKSKIQELVK